MKPPLTPTVKSGIVAALVCFLIVTFVLWRTKPGSNLPPQIEPEAPALLQTVAFESNPETRDPAANPDSPPPTSAAPSGPAEPGAPTGVAGPTPAASPAAGQPPAVSPAAPSPPEADQDSEEILVSFQGANVDIIVQWLAKTSGKSVVKHPKVQCQLTIVSSGKLPRREAMDLVYRALSLEGFAVVESSNAILIVPEGQEPRMSPQMMESAEIPPGRQRLIRIFQVEHTPVEELRERIKVVLSDKAVVEVDARSNKLIVTDYNENLRLIGELLPELDVVSSSDMVTDIYPLKYSDAEELATLLNLVLNQQAGSPSPPGRPSPPPGSGPPGMPSPGPGGSSSPNAGAASGAPGTSQTVRLWPDKTSNRLIVSAPASRISEVQMMVDLLDTEKPADVAIRVIPLRNASAEDLVKAIAPLSQKMSGRSLKDIIEVTANNRGNSLIVLSSESNFRTIQSLVDTLDTEDSQERVLEAFPLLNADAEDVAKQLEDLHRDQQATTPRFIYIWPPPPTPTSKMSFVADRRRNTVIVQGPPAAMDGIRELIEALDEPVTDQGLAPRIYQLKYVSAVDIEDVLNELFLKRQQQRSYWDYYSGSQETTRDIGRLYGKVRITSEPYSNSIIVTSNSLENLQAIEDVLRQLDVPSQAGETTLRVGLKFANAVTLASSINVLYARGGSPPLRPQPQPGTPNEPRPQQQQTGAATRGFELEREMKEDSYFPWLGGQPETYRTADNRTGIRPVSDLVGKVRVVPDRRSNSLLVTSNVHYFPQIVKLISELDAPTSQILIEARIIEVASDFRDRLGVRFSPDGRRMFDPEDFDHSIMPSAAASFREIFAGSPLPGSLRTGVLDATVNLDVLIQFLRKNTEATVLAEPQISVSDNELGQLFVGSQIPFISATSFTPEGSRNDVFQYRDVGIILEVTPHINNSDEVAMKIRVESSNMRNGVTLFGGAILDTRNFRTDVLVKSGQTLVLGGILQREEVETIRKVPVLGSIPVLGWAFKKKDKGAREVELMVFLRPVITRTPEEVRRLAEEIEERTPRLKAWREDRLDN